MGPRRGFGSGVAPHVLAHEPDRVDHLGARARVRSASIVPAKPPVPCTMKGTTVERGPAGGHLVFLPITPAVIPKQRFVRRKNQKLTRATGFFRETFSERCEAAAKEAGKGARTGGTKG